MTNHPTLGLVDVFAATIPGLKFTPSVHINYSERVPAEDHIVKAHRAGAQWWAPLVDMESTLHLGR